MKRLFVCLLSLLMAFSVLSLAACGGKGQNNDATGDADSAATGGRNGSEQGTEEEITFPEKTYGYSDFRVLCTDQCVDYYDPDENEEDIVSRAAFRSNNLAEEKYQVEIVYKPMEGRSAGRDAFAAEVRTSSLDSGSTYDIVIGQTYYTMALALEGLYFNMASSPYIQLERPWYDKDLVNDNIMINNKLYAASGGYVVSQISTMMGIYYNKDFYRNYQLASVINGTDIYDTVRKGDWTYEIFYEMTTSVYEDADNDGKVSKGDIYGLIGNTHAPMCAMIGSDVPFTEKNEWGEVSTDHYYNQHLLDVFETYFNFYNKEESVYYIASDEDLIEAFCNAQALFCCHAVEYMAKTVVRDANVDYGVLPHPKFNSEQDSYYTNNIRWEVANIPKSCDTERAAILFDYLNYTYYKEFVPQFFDLALSTQAAPTPEDSEMMYLIRDCVRFDFATFYQSQIGLSYSDNIYIGVKSLIRSGNPGIANWWETNSELYQKSIQNLMDLYFYYLDED